MSSQAKTALRSSPRPSGLLRRPSLDVVAPQVDVDIPPLYFPLLNQQADYKVYYGGRAAARSWSFARAIVARMHTEKIRVGCFREYQSSIGDSVHHLLKSQVSRLGFD